MRVHPLKAALLGLLATFVAGAVLAGIALARGPAQGSRLITAAALLMVVPAVLLAVGVGLFFAIACVSTLVGPRYRTAFDLTLLLKDPGGMTPERLATAVAAATTTDVRGLKVRRASRGQPSACAFRTPQVLVELVHHDIPSWSEPQKLASALLDPAVQRAVGDHTASLDIQLSVRAASSKDQDKSKDVAGVLGRLCRELIDSNCLAVLTTERVSAGITPIDSEFVATMRAAPPDHLAEQLLTAPAISVDHDNPLVQEAIRKTREALPQFLRLLAQADEHARYFAYVTATDGEATEHVWIEVEDAAGDRIVGTLLRAPRGLTGVTAGSPISADLHDVQDWIVDANEYITGDHISRAIGLQEHRRY